jgi:hypothetical protein
MVRKHMPNALATAKGHLDRKPSSNPHANSDAVSALRRHHTRSQHDQQRLVGQHAKPTVPFSPTAASKSSTLHLDYTCALPEVCTSGTRYFQIACWGGYINLQPLVSLRAEHTTQALRATVEFFSKHDVQIDKVRMDNQQSQPSSHPTSRIRANRAERAIRTAKNHIIASRAGFHPDCPHMYLDKCLGQMELTLNVVRPYDYDPTKSAFEGVMGYKYNFKHHPIAPVGSKVLTWDCPEHRGRSWHPSGLSWPG